MCKFKPRHVYTDCPKTVKILAKVVNPQYAKYDQAKCVGQVVEIVEVRIKRKPMDNSDPVLSDGLTHTYVDFRMLELVEIIEEHDHCKCFSCHEKD